MGFGDQLGRLCIQAEEKIGEVRDRTCLLLADGIIMNTPVLTGRARGEWQAGIGQAPGGLTNTSDPSGASAKAQASSVIESMALSDTFVLVNRVPYILPLEMGSSAKAPNGMVRITTQRFPSIVTQAVAETK